MSRSRGVLLKRSDAHLLIGKVILVTGAGRGIGRAIALDAASRGARLILNDLDEALISELAAQIGRSGGKAEPIAGSVSDWETAQSLVAGALSRFGRLDGLVNNAGLHYQALPWEETEAQIRSLIEVNVLGAIYCGVHALKVMAAQGAGAVVNITSGALLGVDARGVYGASKGAVASLTFGWAKDMASQNVRVNAVAPLAATRMTIASLEEGDPGGAGAPQFDDLPPPEKLAPLVSFLLSDAAANVNGEILRFTGRELTRIEPPRITGQGHARDGWSLGDFESVCADLLS